MKTSRTEKVAAGGLNVITTAVIVAASVMWLTTAADELLHLGWGWDRQILWTAPIILVAALITRIVGRSLF